MTLWQRLALENEDAHLCPAFLCAASFSSRPPPVWQTWPQQCQAESILLRKTLSSMRFSKSPMKQYEWPSLGHGLAPKPAALNGLVPVGQAVILDSLGVCGREDSLNLISTTWCSSLEERGSITKRKQGILWETVLSLLQSTVLYIRNAPRSQRMVWRGVQAESSSQRLGQCPSWGNCLT